MAYILEGRNGKLCFTTVKLFSEIVDTYKKENGIPRVPDTMLADPEVCKALGAILRRKAAPLPKWLGPGPSYVPQDPEFMVDMAEFLETCGGIVDQE